MKNQVIRTIINNTFLPNYCIIHDYFKENNLDYNGEYKIDGGFTLNYNCSDTKETFEKNLKTQPEDWYYRTHPVKYTLNSSGYRTREFDDIDWKESIVIFGCSHTFGTGVTDEHTIPYFLEQLSGRPVINMGIGGSSIQTSLHNSIILVDSEYPTPKAVVYIWTALSRFQIYEEDFVNLNGFWSGKIIKIQKFSNSNNTIPFNLMNIKMIRNLWKNKTIYREIGMFASGENLIMKLDSKFNSEYPQFLVPMQENPEFEVFDEKRYKARDLAHFGIKYNKRVSELLFENIKSNI